MEKIPEHILEAINCGELKASDFYEKYGSEEIENALSALKKSDAEILNQIDEEIFYRSVIQKQNNRKTKNVFVKTRYFSLAAAAVLLLVLTPVVLLKNNQVIQNESPIRVKGSKVDAPQLFLYRQNKGDADLLKNGESACKGDVIQIAFNPNGKKYALIFSIDGNKQLTPHLENENLLPQTVQDKISLLDFSYELDAAPDYEVFVLVTSDNEFDISETLENLKSKKLKYIQKGKYLPKNTEYTTFLLKK